MISFFFTFILLLQHSDHHGNSGNFWVDAWEIPTRGVCWSWNWALLAPYLLAQFTIFAVYFGIPAAAFWLVRQRRGKWFNYEVFWIGLFVLMCGITHLFNVLLVAWSLYIPATLWDFATAVVSIYAFYLIVRKIRTLAKLPDYAELVDRRAAIQSHIDELEIHSTNELDSDRDKALLRDLKKTVSVLDKTIAGFSILG